MESTNVSYLRERLRRNIFTCHDLTDEEAMFLITELSLSVALTKHGALDVIDQRVAELIAKYNYERTLSPASALCLQLLVGSRVFIDIIDTIEKAGRFVECVIYDGDTYRYGIRVLENSEPIDVGKTMRNLLLSHCITSEEVYHQVLTLLPTGGLTSHDAVEKAVNEALKQIKIAPTPIPPYLTVAVIRYLKGKRYQAMIGACMC